MKRSLGFIIVVTLFLIMFAFVSESVAINSASTPWPTTGWQTSTPEEQGVDSQQIVNLLQANSDAHTLLAVRHGKLIVDVSCYPFTSTQPHALFSVTKSFVSTLVGIAIDKGYIKSVKQSIWDYFPKDKTANMDARKEALTIEHLLTHTSGLSVADENSFYKLTDKDPSWVQVMLDGPMQSDPGTKFQYSNINPHLASAIIQLTTKMSASAFAEEYLFAPLGITDATWIADPQGVNEGGVHLFMSPASMAKLGYLYLNGGQWDGQQIVSADWIGQASKVQVKDAVAPLDYGYFWWSGQVARTEHRFYAAMGMMGQNIWVVPDLDLVVVTTNDLSNDGQAIISAIAKAAVSDQPLAPNPSALKILQARVDELAHPQAAPVKPIPDAARVSSGKVYQLEPNDFGWKSIAIDFAKPDEALFMIGLPDKVLKLPVGMDTVYRVSTEGLPAESVWRPIANVPQMVRAGFLGKRLMIYMADCMGMEFWTLTVDFSKDGSKLWVSAQALNDTSATFSMSHDLVGSS